MIMAEMGFGAGSMGLILGDESEGRRGDRWVKRMQKTKDR